MNDYADQSIFDQRMVINSIKSNTGHCLAAAGAIEAIYTILSINQGLIVGNLNLDIPVEMNEISNQISGSKQITNHNLTDFIKLPTQVEGLAFEWNSPNRTAMTNSFGFGGTNGTLIFSQWFE